MNGLKNSRNLASEPKDTYKIAYILHFFLGAGNLLPWNALITAIDYFGYLYPNKHVEKVFSVAYMASSLCILGVLLSWDWCRKRLSFRLRMNLGFSMFVLSLMLTPIMHWIWHGNGLKMKSSMGYNLVVATVVICGLADGLIAGSLIGTAGKLPRQYMQAIFAGTASSGVLISILRIITKASLPQTPQGLKTSANLYFLASTIILMGCIICCNLLCNLPFMQRHYNLVEEDTQQLLSSPKFWEIARRIRWPAFGIFMIYTVTLSIFPGFLAENIESNLFKDWYPVMLIAVYNISDFVGKSLTGIYVLESIGKATWGCIGRILFYPMFSVCFRGPEWLRTEAPVVVLTLMLGLSNGYLTSVVMILAPKAVPQPEAEIAAIVMVVFLGLGLVAGSLVGWFWII
ncbi:equilibrative nucleotide transporter 8-like [Olea europaea var. sylvestris]|uniref:equilibrative nucleotide transporter 8-like n=1 Tax=Olea europaea var. sylvestris TaxID=158386 RepID=UPI000C1D3295|nr:equilibrative nucleotide transporter 8-like [Olea europaea var. sylvestris]